MHDSMAVEVKVQALLADRCAYQHKGPGTWPDDLLRTWEEIPRHLEHELMSVFRYKYENTLLSLCRSAIRGPLGNILGGSGKCSN